MMQLNQLALTLLTEFHQGKIISDPKQKQFVYKIIHDLRLLQ